MNELQKTKAWFEQAIPEPTDKQKCVQMGVHIEEIAEMFDAMGPTMKLWAKSTHELADFFKECGEVAMDVMTEINRAELLDSLVDQQVTSTGVGHMLGMHILGALTEVNRSNFSKFEDGKPVFDANGKITKGKDYTPPELGDFI